jgi:hypothetical protein
MKDAAEKSAAYEHTEFVVNRKMAGTIVKSHV